MTRRTLSMAALGVVAALYTGDRRTVAAQQTHDHPAGAAPAAPQADADRMRMHAEMMSAMKAKDAKLSALVKAMDGATGNAKIETIATIIRELVTDQKAMHEHMAEMHQHMHK